jgi:hypothetical protein
VAAPAAPTLDVALDGSFVECTIGVPATSETLYLERSSDGSTWTPVSGGYGLAVTPGTTIVVDYEAPLGIALTYRAAVANVDGASPATSDGPITVPSSASDDPWLIDLVEPANSQQVVVERLAELSHFVPTGVHNVIGRTAPIVTSDVSKAPTFELAFVTPSLAARDKARATLSSGHPVLLRTPPEHGVGELYLSVLSWIEQRPSRVATVTDRRFIVSGQEVDAPAP